jgi:hypothetical protein
VEFPLPIRRKDRMLTMNKLVLGFAAAATLGAAALAGAGAAQAQGFSFSFGTPGYYAPVGGPHWGGPPAYGYYGPPRRRHWGPPPGYGAPYGYYRAPRCFLRPVTVWNGWGYVTQHQRVCR